MHVLPYRLAKVLCGKSGDRAWSEIPSFIRHHRPFVADEIYGYFYLRIPRQVCDQR